jgi:hypothetical protein
MILKKFFKERLFSYLRYLDTQSSNSNLNNQIVTTCDKHQSISKVSTTNETTQHYQSNNNDREYSIF